MSRWRKLSALVLLIWPTQTQTQTQRRIKIKIKIISRSALFNLEPNLATPTFGAEFGSAGKLFELKKRLKLACEKVQEEGANEREEETANLVPANPFWPSSS